MSKSTYVDRDYNPSKNRYILGTLIDATSYEEATRKVITWAERGESRYVCAANVHMIMEGFNDPEFMNIINSADIVTPDGMPLVWGLRQLGIGEAEQVCGPNLTMHVCEAAASSGIPIALYGCTEEVLASFTTLLCNRFPSMRVVCRISPPFRPLSADEDDVYTQQIVASGARILFIGIGCPKQERWMAQHKSKISAVMLGVGAAIDFHSGRVKRAPIFMQRTGFEWLFRLCMEPRRLWKRYLKHNTGFVFHFCVQLTKAKLHMVHYRQ
jgi:N-acetylglucosaminyldiphosphoundecaprenol N-acetyl-beta-D-mannosaminyltransferase